MPNLPPKRLDSVSRDVVGSVVTTLLLLLVLPGVGCDRNIEPYRAGEESSPPDLARIFPGPSGGIGSAEGANAESGQADRAALPPSRAESSAVSAVEVTAPIEGQVELAGELARARPEGGVLFVIARPRGALQGPPLAVLRIPSPVFPLEFSIGPDDVMIPNVRFEGAISLSARLDADGNAMTRGASDLSSPVAEPLSPGARGVRLVLSEQG
jgi:hypothetical protein